MNNIGLMEMASGASLALRGVEVSARIAGLLAETTLSQKYRNDGQDNLELAYTDRICLGKDCLKTRVQASRLTILATNIPLENVFAAGRTSGFAERPLDRRVLGGVLDNRRIFTHFHADNSFAPITPPRWLSNQEPTRKPATAKAAGNNSSCQTGSPVSAVRVWPLGSCASR